MKVFVGGFLESFFLSFAVLKVYNRSKVLIYFLCILDVPLKWNFSSLCSMIICLYGWVSIKSVSEWVFSNFNPK